MEFKDYLKIMVMKDASDLYLSTGAPPCAKFHGQLKVIEKATLTPQRVKDIAYDIMSEEQARQFEEKPEMNLAISEPNLGRFRVNIFKQRNTIGMVVRNIKTQIPQWQELGLPPVLT